MSDSQYQITEFDLSMPDELIKSEILNQIIGTSPIYNVRKNLLTVFARKLELRKTRDEDYDDDIDELIADTTDEFYKEVVTKLRESCGILINYAGDNSALNIQYIYDMFIIHLHDNIVEYLSQFIQANKNTYLTYFSDDESTNLSVRMARRNYKNKADATIVIHCSEIINMILSEGVNPEHILEILYRYNQEDYEYLLSYNMFSVGYLSFDIPTFQEYLERLYSDPVANANLKVLILERLLPTFKLKENSTDE